MPFWLGSRAGAVNAALIWEKAEFSHLHLPSAWSGGDNSVLTCIRIIRWEFGVRETVV